MDDLIRALMEATGEDPPRSRGEGSGSSKPVERISHDGTIARLHEAAERFLTDQVPFKPGDLIMGRKDAPVAATGEPLLVLEVLQGQSCRLDGTGNDGAPFGMRVNIRFLALRCDKIGPVWSDAAFYELYTGEGAD